MKESRDDWADMNPWQRAGVIAVGVLVGLVALVAISGVFRGLWVLFRAIWGF
jgi:hypothetical protein